jgi:hypothetical protein
VEGMEFLPRKVEAKQMIFNWSTFSSTPFFLFDLHIFVTDFESSFSVCHTIFFLCVCDFAVSLVITLYSLHVRFPRAYCSAGVMPMHL